ncbi:MAG: hypothetical protein M3016_09890, partial [Actinomycetota bacterium]|nr:hypothetical protein [Actinomycetota bacterium]
MSVETVLLVVLLILVAGLLRSHAEILRRLGAAATEGPRAETAPGLAVPQAPDRAPGAPAAAVAGLT